MVTNQNLAEKKSIFGYMLIIFFIIMNDNFCFFFVLQ